MAFVSAITDDFSMVQLLSRLHPGQRHTTGHNQDASCYCDNARNFAPKQKAPHRIIDNPDIAGDLHDNGFLMGERFG